MRREERLLRCVLSLRAIAEERAAETADGAAVLREELLGPYGGRPVTGYTATCVSSNGGITRTATGAASPLTVTALTNGKTYTCTVFATNSEGDSAPSIASASTVPATLPGAPPQFP